MSMEEHRGTSMQMEDDGTGAINLNEMNQAIREAQAGSPAAQTGEQQDADDDDDNNDNSAANVIPKEKLANGLNAAKGIWDATVSRARKSIADFQESEAGAKLRDATKPVVGAVVEGAKVAGEKIAQGAEAAKPQLESAGVKLKAGLVEVGHVLHDAAEKSRPALEKAGSAIKTTAIHVAEQAKPTVDKVGAAVTTGVSQAGHWVSDKIKGKDGGEGGGPSHTV